MGRMHINQSINRPTNQWRVPEGGLHADEDVAVALPVDEHVLPVSVELPVGVGGGGGWGLVGERSFFFLIHPPTHTHTREAFTT